jgi:uncharacterized flavoprotein (TIGR03862 family)
VRDWIHGLGIDTFVGTSGRVFPTDMKAAPLLRAWLHRLRETGVRFHMRHRWLGWRDGALLFATPDGERLRADAVVLALGGGSWARLGSDGAWVPLLAARAWRWRRWRRPTAASTPTGARISQPHAGAPLTTVALALDDADGRRLVRKGQFVVTAGGIEGSLVYALSAPIRDQIARDGQATVLARPAAGFRRRARADEVTRARGTRSMSSHLQSRLGIKGVKSGLLHECLSKEDYAIRQAGAAIKACRSC